jgi:hypothetical protein
VFQHLHLSLRQFQHASKLNYTRSKSLGAQRDRLRRRSLQRKSSRVTLKEKGELQETRAGMKASATF